MGYYIGLEITGASIKLINVRKRGMQYYLERKLSINLEQPLNLDGKFEEHCDFTNQLKQVLTHKKRFKGSKIGILLPSDRIIRRIIHVPDFTNLEMKSYIEVNKAQLLPLAADTSTIDYEICTIQPNQDYKHYQIRGIDHTFLAPFMIWLENLGFHTLTVSTLGDTLPYMVMDLKRQGRCCLLCTIGEVWYVLFYENNQCIYEYTIRKNLNDTINMAWELFRVMQFMHHYGNGELEEVVYLYSKDTNEEDRNKEIVDEVGRLLNRQIEYRMYSTTLNYTGLMGLMIQMSNGGKRYESCTYSL